MNDGQVRERQMKINKSTNYVAFFNILSVIVLQGISFLSTPIFSRLLGTEQYGQYSVFNSWVTIVSCFVGLGMSTSLGTGRYHFKDEYNQFRTSVLLSSVLFGLIECGVFIIAMSFIGPIGDFTTITFVFVSVLSVSHYVLGFVQGAYVYEKKAVQNFILSTITALSTTLLSVYFVLRLPEKERYLGRVYGMMIPYAAIAIVLIVLLLYKQKLAFQRKHIIFALQVGFPLVFHSLSQTLLSQSDRVMMQMMNIQESEIGIYSLFHTMSSALTVVLNALNNTWCPFYYDYLSAADYSTIKKKTTNYIELFSIITFCFLLLSPEVSLLMADSSYSGGVGLLPIVIASVYFTFMYQFPVNYEFFNKKTKIIATGTIFAGVTNVILNYLLIPKYGMYGAAIATSISYFALFVAHFFIVNRFRDVAKFHMHLKSYLPGVILVSMGVLIFYLLNDYWYIRWAIGVVLGSVELFRMFRRKSIF